MADSMSVDSDETRDFKEETAQAGSENECRALVPYKMHFTEFLKLNYYLDVLESSLTLPFLEAAVNHNYRDEIDRMYSTSARTSSTVPARVTYHCGMVKSYWDFLRHLHYLASIDDGNVDNSIWTEDGSLGLRSLFEDANK